MDLTNASAIVTGGAGGFGSATVRRLAQKGAKVLIADVSDERGEALAREVDGSLYVPTDCMDEDAIAEAVKAAAGLGPLRAAVITHIGPHAPGEPGPARMLDSDGNRHTLAKFLHVINVYLNSAFAVTSQAAEEMARNEPLASNERGVIINTASIAAFEGRPGQAAYSAAKGGIIGMTLTIARDLASHGIRVMAIAPGPFFTLSIAEITRLKGMTVEQVQERLGSIVPNPNRLGDPDEYAILAAQIVENDFLNGTTIRLDGALRL
jgi:NAD(P)-dependent dehydrogenase (short-subunit alcohol dehydrogenase family)